MSKFAKVLFFIAGSVPTNEEKTAFNAIAVKRKGFRNINFISESDAVEKCDAVEGKVPPQYSKIPSWAQFLEKQKTDISEVAKNSGETPAPKVTKQPTKKSWGAK